MSFECPYFNDDICKLQKGLCKPGIGKCILKGKVQRARDIKIEQESEPESDG